VTIKIKNLIRGYTSSLIFLKNVRDHELSAVRMKNENRSTVIGSEMKMKTTQWEHRWTGMGDVE
jgi:hypothetical protein